MWPKSKKNRWIEWKTFQRFFKKQQQKKRLKNLSFITLFKFLLPFTGCRKVLGKIPDRSIQNKPERVGTGGSPNFGEVENHPGSSFFPSRGFTSGSFSFGISISEGFCTSKFFLAFLFGRGGRTGCGRVAISSDALSINQKPKNASCDNKDTVRRIHPTYLSCTSKEVLLEYPKILRKSSARQFSKNRKLLQALQKMSNIKLIFTGELHARSAALTKMWLN